MTFRGPLYTNPLVPYWNVGFINGDNSVFIVRPGKPPLPTNYDWPLPVQPSRIDATWIETGNAYYAVISRPNNQYDWPNPVPPFRMEQTWIQTPDVIPPPNKPLNQTDWPNPAPLSYFDRTWIGYQPSNTLPPIGFPFNQKDWPLPVQPNKLDNQTWLETGNAFPPFPVQGFNQFDWPNPVQPNRLDETWIETGNVYYPLGNPFHQTDWPNPLPIYDQGLTWIQTGYPGGIPAPNQPFNTFDWPLTDRYQTPDSTWSFYNDPLYTTPVVQVPHNQYDWKVPLGPYRLEETWINTPRIIPPPNKPFNTTDWPVPTGYPRPDETYVWYFPEVNLAIPFSQHDWPLPGRYPTPDGTWINIQQITPFVQSPFSQHDWPVPTGYPRLDETWLNQGIQIQPTVPMPLLSVRENTVYYPKFFSIDTIPPNTTVFIPLPPPPVQPVGGGRQWHEKEWNKIVAESWHRPDVKAAAATISSLGGHARAAALTSKQRSAIASKAASIRWK